MKTNKKYILITCFMIMSFAFSQKNVFDVAKIGDLSELYKIIETDSELINKIDEKGFTPLIYSCYYGNLSIAKELINRVKDINYKSKEGTALMACVMSNKYELFELLINKGADINCTNFKNVSVLMLCIQFNKIDFIKLLLKNKPDLNIIDDFGKTAFQYAIENKNEVIIKLLTN